MDVCDRKPKVKKIHMELVTETCLVYRLPAIASTQSSLKII